MEQGSGGKLGSENPFVISLSAGIRKTDSVLLLILGPLLMLSGGRLVSSLHAELGKSPLFPVLQTLLHVLPPACLLTACYGLFGNKRIVLEEKRITLRYFLFIPLFVRKAVFEKKEDLVFRNLPSSESIRLGGGIRKFFRFSVEMEMHIFVTGGQKERCVCSLSLPEWEEHRHTILDYLKC